MKTTALNIMLAILVSIFWTSTALAQDSPPAGWRKLDVEGKFSFYLPPNMRYIARGMENLHGEYTNGRMQVSFDYDAFFRRSYENRALAGKDFQETELQVDGKKAYLFAYQSNDYKNRRWYSAEIHIGDLPNCKVILWITVSSRSPRVIEIAKKIFRTLRLPSA
ncbi:MAG: hypothetical protein V7638_1311 [Acidobacteriota bacterium]|jgi:hypothetical protein